MHELEQGSLTFIWPRTPLAFLQMSISYDEKAWIKLQKSTEF